VVESFTTPHHYCPMSVQPLPALTVTYIKKNPPVRCVAANRRVIAVTPTRQAETHSKLFCIDRLIPFGFI